MLRARGSGRRPVMLAIAGDSAAGKTSVEALRNAGINSMFYESPGTAHEWLTWRRSLHEFAPQLFKN